MPSPVIITSPCTGWVTDSIAIGPPSASRSLPRTSIAAAAVSWTTDFASSTAVGGSSTHVTVTVTVAVEPPGASV